MFFQDEARFGRINDPRHCWAPEHCRPDAPKQIVREYTYAYGAVCPFDGDACYLILPAMNGDCMNVFLQELSSRYPHHFLLVAYDGAPCHSPGVLNVPSNMMLIKLPPYSPNLNPQENNWDDMREKFFHNLVFNSIAAVEDQLVVACNDYEAHPEIIQSMTAWNWIINSSLEN